MWRRILWTLLGAVLVAGLAGQAQALTIHTVYTPLGGPGNAWRAEFFLDEPTFSADQGFTVSFDYDSFANLDNGQADGDTDPDVGVWDSGASWDLWVDQPVPSLYLDGIFDAFALVDNAPTDGPFTVEFDWLGTGAPGPLGWEKYELDQSGNWVLLDQGETTATVVPEPGTLLLLGTGLAGVAGWRRRQR